MQNPHQEPPAPINAQNQNLKDMDVLCTFEINLKSQKLENGQIEDQWQYPNHYQDDKP